MEEHNTAAEALDNIQTMADEMEERYERQVDLLKLQVEDASSLAEEYFQKTHDLHSELAELRDWNKVHYALYFFLFVYGMVYGAYFTTKQQEL